MKKNYTLLLLVLSAMTSFAQLTRVNYRGAFAPAPTPQWTLGWTNFDPKNTVYPSPNTAPAGGALIRIPASGSGAVISTNTTWTKNNTYVIAGLVYVKSGVTLTIEPGTIIFGSNAVANSSLVITKGAKLIANGTPSQPIVFTSSYPAGFRNPGDWGGIILLGKASYNGTSSATSPTPSTYGINYLEGITEVNNSATTGESTEFGGGATPDDNDTSGILRYVRIEFGGYIFAQNKEINGLTMGAIGRGTVIDNVQCSFINDDAFEWFGGTVNCSHLVSFRGVDDEWDTDNGYSGTVQFCLGVRDPLVGDNSYSLASGGSTSEGYESDNDANGSSNDPRTKAIFANITNIGPLRGNNSAANVAAIHPAFRRAARLRRNTELKIYNSILADYPTGLMIDNALGNSAQNAVDNKLRFNKNIISGVKAGGLTETAGTLPAGFDARTYVRSKNDSALQASSYLTAPYGYGGTAGTTVLTGTGGTSAPAVGAVWPVSAYTSADYRPKTTVSTGIPNSSTGALWDTSGFGSLKWKIDSCPNPVKPASITGVTSIIKLGCDSIQTFSVPAAPGHYYFWTVPTGSIIRSGNGSNSIVVRLNNAATGSIVISVIASNGCKSATATTLTVSVVAVPSAPASITQTIVTNACNNRIIRFTAPVLPAGATGYLWSLTSGPLAATGVVDSGTLTSRIVRIKFTSNAAAGSLDSIRVRYTWNGCGSTANKAAKLMLTALTCKLAKNTVEANAAIITASINPNPNKGQFNLMVGNTGINAKTEALVTISDVFGNPVSRFVAVNENGMIMAKINEPKLLNGVYYVRFQIGTYSNTLRMVIIK